MVPKIPILLVSPKFSEFHLKKVEKSRFRSQSRDFCQIFEGFGFSYGQFGLGKKSLCFGFGKFGLGKKVSVSEKFGLGKKSRFRKIWYRKKVSVSVSVKILVSSFSGHS